jgi:3-oxoadipate enol-lactonase
MSNINYLDPNPGGYPAVLLLHGLGADAASWTLQLPALSAAGFRPLATDTPGFGHSDYDGRGWSIRRMAAELASLVRHLVLVSTFALLRPDTLSGWFYFLQRFIIVNTLGLPAQAKFVSHRVFPGPKYEQLRGILVETISQADPRAYRLAMTSLGLFNSTKRLSEIKAPTLVVTGADDTTVTPARQRLLLDGISKARQVIIPDAGHAVPVDQAQRFNQQLLTFLGNH